METQQNYISEKVRDEENVIINPATEENQTILGDLTQALYEIVERLTFFTWVKGVLADLRVTPTGTVTVWGTITTVTTVTTVATLTNQSQNGWYFTNAIVPSATNTNAILSNINNIIIS